MATLNEKPAKKKKRDDEEKKPVIVKNVADLQRLKLEKLMKNPDKPVVIPERPKGKNTPHVPEFVRNVMGSSAGAGSGEFHVYRHLRRKEYARQKFIQEKADKESLEDEYHRKIEENRIKAEEATAKKRAKRLKKKKSKKFKKPKMETKSESSSEEESDEGAENPENKTIDSTLVGGQSSEGSISQQENAEASSTKPNDSSSNKSQKGGS